MNEFFNDLWLSQRVLILSGFGFLVATAVFAGSTLFDSTQILGINRWIKPLKFSSSIAIFLLTLAIYFYFLPNFEKSKNLVACGATLLMLGEMALITMQAARGTTSHFNVAKSFDAAVFAAMGLMIVVNSLLVAYLAILYFRADFALPNSIVWGLRFGLILFLLGSVQGGYMGSQVGHAVNATDGGAGLPLVNWSTKGGDLRVAHFLGLHALQIVPIFALGFQYFHEKFAFPAPVILTAGFAIIYFGLFNFLFVQAVRGKPLFGEKSSKLIKNSEEFEIKNYVSGH